MAASKSKYKVDVETSAPKEPTAVDVVAAVETVRRWIVAQREAIAAQGGDATSAAGELAAALLGAGGRIPEGRGDQLRWFINETPTPIEDPKAYGAAQTLVSYLYAALKKGPGEDERLTDIAQHWPACRTKAEASERVGAIESARAEAAARVTYAKHEAWLGSRPKTNQVPAPVAVRPDGPPKPLFGDDNDLTVG